MASTDFEMEIERQGDEDGFRLGGSHVVLGDGDWICWARELTGRKGLFLYHHTVHDTVVLCEWIDKERRLCTELHAFPVHPQHRPSQAPAEWLRRRCRSASEQFREMQQQILRGKAAARAEQAKQLDERTQVAQEFRRKGKKQLAAELDSGTIPWSRSDATRESQREQKKELMRASRNPVQVVSPGGPGGDS